MLVEKRPVFPAFFHVYFLFTDGIVQSLGLAGYFFMGWLQRRCLSLMESAPFCMVFV
ncbi:hypothetical protein LZ24_01922 [Desulfobotulus alkaliphilus]|uniref:Uncharacterized protein n=1 Tax=Desulfobotulus alkaliphilus TaxID=622671 RepID=A0A562RRE0_9BACT|nr:hypothetical protein LZ24_01922 [Desulfobotulus alkaliphilus]